MIRHDPVRAGSHRHCALSDLGAGGREFESPHPDHIYQVLAAARSTRAADRSTERGTVSWLVRRYVAGRTDITLKSREQYEWAIPHIENGLRAIQLSLLDRDDVATWIGNLAQGGKLCGVAFRSAATCCGRRSREAVDEGLIPRSPAARVGLPRTVARPEPTSTPRPVPCGSTRASWPHGPAPPGATPRTNDPAGSSRSATRRSVSSPGVEPHRPRNGWPLVSSGRTRISSSRRESAGSCCPARSMACAISRSHISSMSRSRSRSVLTTRLRRAARAARPDFADRLR